MPRRDQRAYNARYYATSRATEVQRVRARQIATVAFLRDLRSMPCVDCGVQFAGYQMDFDHRDPSLKSFRLSAGRAMLRSRQELLAEAAKCDVVCANCHRVRTRQRHRERLRARGESKASSQRIDERRARWRWHADLLDQLRAIPCQDCGQRFPPCAMDFDHRDAATKAQGVTRMIGRSGIDRILAEVAKCDIVCANCHRRRTFERRLGGDERA